MVPSQGHAPVTVPNIPGAYTFAQAQAALGAVGFTATQVTISSATVPAGQVISTSPASGTVAPYGSAVTVTVSSGPPTVAVPNVLGETVTQATAALQGAGLVVSGVTGSPSASVKGTVPATNQVVPIGSSVQILTKYARAGHVLGLQPESDLCEAAKLSAWHHEDDICGWPTARCAVCPWWCGSTTERSRPTQTSTT